MKRFWKRFCVFFLLPIIPVLGVIEGGSDGGSDKDDGTTGDDKDDKDGGDSGDNKNDNKDDNKNDNKNDSKDDKKGRNQDKLFTQEELDAVISRRLDRERKTWEQKVEDEKKKAAMTEAERLKVEKEEAEKKASAATERANQRLIRSEVIAQASKMNIIDPDAAFTLLNREGITVEDDDSVKGVKEALALLVKSKPYLVKTEDKGQTRTGDDQGDDKGSRGGISMNSLIRKAAGRG
jgi:hypothetical protein